MTTTPPLPAAVNLLTIFNSTPKHIPTQQPPNKQKPIRHPHKHSPSPHIFHIPSWPHSYKRPPRRFTFATKHVVTGGEIMEPNVDGFHGRWGRQPSVELQLPRHITSPVNATSSPILSFVETSSPMISPLVPLEYMEHMKLPSPMSQTIVYPSPTTTPTTHESSTTTSTTYESSTQSTPITQTMTPITRKMTLPPPTTQNSPILISSSMTPAMSTPSNNGHVPTPKAKAPPSTPVISAQQPHQQPSPQQLPPQKPQPQKQHTRTRTIPTLPPSWVTISMTPTQDTSTPQPIHCLCTTSPCHHIIDIPSTYMYPSPSYSELSSYRSTCSNSPLIPHESNRPPTHTRYPSQWHHWRVPSYCHFDSPNQKVATN